MKAEGVARNFDRGDVDSGDDHLVEESLELGCFRRGARHQGRGVADTRTDRTDNARRLTVRDHNLLEEVGHGRLAVRPGHAYDGEPVGGVVEDGRGKPWQCDARTRDDETAGAGHVVLDRNCGGTRCERPIDEVVAVRDRTGDGHEEAAGTDLA